MKLAYFLWKALNAFMLLLFVISAAVQCDFPIYASVFVPGVTIYGAAGLVCILAIRETNVILLPPIVGVIALVWALMLAPQVIGKASFGDIFILREMEREYVGVGRQMTGLWVVAFWMAMVTIVFLHPRSTGK